MTSAFASLPLRDAWNNLNDFNDFRSENGSSPGQILALTGFIVPSSLDKFASLPL